MTCLSGTMYGCIKVFSYIEKSHVLDFYEVGEPRFEGMMNNKIKAQGLGKSRE